MTIADHGGFDILVDGTAALVNRVLAGRIPPIAVDQPFSTPDASGTAEVRLRATAVRFDPGESIIVTFSLAGSQARISTANGFVIPPDLPGIVLDGTVEIRDTLDASGLNVVLDTAANVPRGTPLVTVTLDRPAFLASPIVELIVARAFLLGGDAGATQAREQLIITVTTLLHDGLTAALAALPIRQTLFSFPANLAPGTGIPSTVSPIVISSPTGSLRIGARLGGGAGNSTFIGRSNLRTGDGLAFIVSHACLLRDLVRPILDRRFGLTAGGTFVASDPFTWAGRVGIPIPGVGTAFITSLALFTDELGRIVMDAAMSASFVDGGISVSASIRVPATIAVTSGASGLVASFTPGAATVTSSRVDVAAWVYVAIFFGGGPLLLAALAIADAIADSAVAGPIASAVNGALSAITFPIPLPSGIPTLTVTGTSLFQGDAPRRTLSVGGASIPAPGRDHDLVVRLA